MDVKKECRICYESTDQNEMLSPCGCKGTMEHIHSHCLKNSIESNGEEFCGICGQNWRGVTIVEKNKNFIDYIKEESQHLYIYLSIIVSIILFCVSMIIIKIAFFLNYFEFYGNTVAVHNVLVMSIIGSIILSLSTLPIIMLIYDYREWRMVNYQTILLIEITNLDNHNIA